MLAIARVELESDSPGLGTIPLRYERRELVRTSQRTSRDQLVARISQAEPCAYLFDHNLRTDAWICNVMACSGSGTPSNCGSSPRGISGRNADSMAGGHRGVDNSW